MTLLQMSIMGGMMVLAFALLRALAGKYLPRRVFLWMWTAAVCRLLLPFRVSSGVSVFNLLSREEAVISPGNAGTAGIPAGSGAVNSTLTEVKIIFTPSVLPTIWLIGAVLVGSYLLLSWLHWRRKFSRAVPITVSLWHEAYPLRRTMEIRELEGLQTPLTWGVLRPVIVLPAGQAEGDWEQLCCILTHEYVHIRRFDALRKLLLSVTLVIHWFNPAVWLLLHLASRDMELFCDEQALHCLGEERRKTYALTLLAAAEQQGRETIPLCNFFGKSMIEERIVMLKEKKSITVFAAVLAIVMLVGVTTAFATTAEEKEATPPYQGTAEAVDETVLVGELLAAEPDALLWPAEGCDTVSCPFGKTNPVTGVTTDHITIAGEKGANILAAAAGTVIDSGFQSRWGNYLEIEHGGGLITFYTHLEDVYVNRDTTVEQGQIVATLGQSGTATGPCLGFYVSRNGEAMDPMEWFDQ